MKLEKYTPVGQEAPSTWREVSLTIAVVVLLHSLQLGRAQLFSSQSLIRSKRSEPTPGVNFAVREQINKDIFTCLEENPYERGDFLLRMNSE